MTLTPGSTSSPSFQRNAVANGNGTTLDTEGIDSIVMQVMGAFGATITWWGCTNGDWATIVGMNMATGAWSASITAPGLYLVPCIAPQQVQARITDYDHGTINVTGTITHGEPFVYSHAGIAGTIVANQGTSSSLGWATTDAGHAWNGKYGVAGERVLSANASVAPIVVTDLPTASYKLVVTDLVVSVGAALTVVFAEETTGTVLLTLYMAANSTLHLRPRAWWKLATANMRLTVQTSGAGNISVLANYFSQY